jgi:hypothetical protein
MVLAKMPDYLLQYYLNFHYLNSHNFNFNTIATVNISYSAKDLEAKSFFYCLSNQNFIEDLEELKI